MASCVEKECLRSNCVRKGEKDLVRVVDKED